MHLVNDGGSLDEIEVEDASEGPDHQSSGRVGISVAAMIARLVGGRHVELGPEAPKAPEMVAAEELSWAYPAIRRGWQEREQWEGELHMHESQMRQRTSAKLAQPPATSCDDVHLESTA